MWGGERAEDLAQCTTADEHSGDLGLRRRRGQFFGQETTRFVSAVAEWLVLRLAATAERNRRFVGWQSKRLALVIDESEFAFDHERTIGTAADGNRHGNRLMCVDGFRGAFFLMRCWDYHAEACGVKWPKKQT